MLSDNLFFFSHLSLQLHQLILPLILLFSFRLSFYRLRLLTTSEKTLFFPISFTGIYTVLSSIYPYWLYPMSPLFLLQTLSSFIHLYPWSHISLNYNGLFSLTALTFFYSPCNWKIPLDLFAFLVTFQYVHINVFTFTLWWLQPLTILFHTILISLNWLSNRLQLF